MHEEKREKDRRHTQTERKKIDRRHLLSYFSFCIEGHMFVCTLRTEVAVFTLRDGGRGRERERQKVKGPFKISLQPRWPAVCLNREST